MPWLSYSRNEALLWMFLIFFSLSLLLFLSWAGTVEKHLSSLFFSFCPCWSKQEKYLVSAEVSCQEQSQIPPWFFLKKENGDFKGPVSDLGVDCKGKEKKSEGVVRRNSTEEGWIWNVACLLVGLTLLGLSTLATCRKLFLAIIFCPVCPFPLSLAEWLSSAF